MRTRKGGRAEAEHHDLGRALIFPFPSGRASRLDFLLGVEELDVSDNAIEAVDVALVCGALWGESHSSSKAASLDVGMHAS